MLGSHLLTILQLISFGIPQPLAHYRILYPNQIYPKVHVSYFMRRQFQKLIKWYFHVQNEISTSTPSTTEESTTSTTLSTTTIQPNTKPELCKVNFLPARGPLGLLPTPFKICTKKLLKKVPFQKCGKNNNCGGGVRLIFMRIVSISKIVK